MHPLHSSCLLLQVYPCRRAYQLLLEAGVALQEAGQMVQQGLAQLSLSDTPPGSPAAAPTASAATLGLTQHVIRQACMLAANAGEVAYELSWCRWLPGNRSHKAWYSNACNCMAPPDLSCRLCCVLLQCRASMLIAVDTGCLGGHCVQCPSSCLAYSCRFHRSSSGPARPPSLVPV
jgi:hypothetical protein